MAQRFTIKNKVTGFTFNLTKEECDKLVLEEPHNFEVIDKKYKSPVADKPNKKSVYEKLIVDEKKTGEGEGETVDFDSMTIAQLKEYADKKDYDLGNLRIKADIIAKIKELGA